MKNGIFGQPQINSKKAEGKGKMELGLKGKVALVTGAGSQIGFGRGIAVAFAKEGCAVVAADIDLAGAQKTAAECEALGAKSLAVKVDISKADEVDAMAKAALAKFGRVDILVNNAGTLASSPLVKATEREWDINIGVNLKGTFYCIRALLPQMMERKSGKIINFSSIAARTGMGTGLYAAAKAGVIGLTRALAGEVGPSGINVNGIAPGFGDTGFQIIAKTPPEVKEMVAKSVPMRRITTPQDIANMVVFLASDAASDITGQTIQVDGGNFRI
jgi:NAD(P)-dependent dehydrogenase (short-subunit alcohol dehydrogenase family)